MNANKTEWPFNTIIFDLFGTLVPYIGEKEYKLSLLPLARIFNLKANEIESFWSSQEGYQNAITKYNSTQDRVLAFCQNTGMVNPTLH